MINFLASLVDDCPKWIKALLVVGLFIKAAIFYTTLLLEFIIFLLN